MIINYDLDLFGRYLKALAEESSVPVAINQDHGADFESALACIRAGFTSIMADRSSLTFEENAKQVKELVRVAHAVGVSVEGELGHVGSAANEDQDKKGMLTDPQRAKEFIAETGVDCLAVAIGTAHGAYNQGQLPKIDFERLAAIKKATNNFPLVMHGGSGLDDESLAKVAKMGINKVNIGYELFASSIREIEEADTEGNGVYTLADLLSEGYSKRLIHFMKVLDSAGKAWTGEKRSNRPEKAELKADRVM